VILCGDAVYCQDNYDHDSWEGQSDPDRAHESGEMLRHLADEDGALMVYGHDPEQFRILRRAPEASYR
jgi:N-acyl homoserine lactone hydrolase